MTPERIVLVDTMGGLGDLMLALPMIHGIARSHPTASVTVVTSAPWHVLLDRDSAIQQVVPVPARDPHGIATVVRAALEQVRPDLAVTTNRQHGLPELLESLSGTAVTNLWRKPPADELVDRRYARLLAADGWIESPFADLPPRVVLDVEERDAGLALLEDIARGGPPAVLLPDSGMAVKQWSLAAWADLVGRLRRQDRVPLVVTRVAVQAAALRQAGATVVPELGLRALAGVLAAVGQRDGVAIGGDTGPVRLASAVGTRVVGLFGPTLASRYGYRPERSVNLQGWPECPVREPTAITEQACWWTAQCPFTDTHAPRCMSDVAVGTVFEAALATD